MVSLNYDGCTLLAGRAAYKAVRAVSGLCLTVIFREMKLFERSEFLPFSEVKEASRRKKSALNFSLVLSFLSREKERTFFLIIRKLTFQKDG